MESSLRYIGGAAALALSAITAGAADKRPNILFAFGDDFGRYASIYAEIEKDNYLCQLVRTPNFDRMAREGVLFTNAHVPAPSSTPCRSSLCSGQYFWRTGRGAILRGAIWDESIPTFPLLLESNGYDIGFTYKVWSPGEVKDAPYGAGRNRYQARGNKFCLFSQNASKAAGGDYEAAKKKLYDEVAGNFNDFLASREKGKPFCYWWGPTNTHRPWVKGSGKNLWGINPDDLKGKLPPFLPDVPEIREDVADYLGEVMAFDQGLGVLIDILEKNGELDNTVIVVSGDHGIPGFPRAKTNLYDFGTRVAMAVRYPATVASGRVVDDFVNLMDLAPTFLEFGETAIPDVMTGRSVKTVLESGRSGQVDKERTYVVTGRERHVDNARDGYLPYPMRAIVTGKYKYIRNFAPNRWPIGTLENGLPDIDGGPSKTWFMDNFNNPDYSWEVNLGFGKRPYEELYDLEKDPWETRNLVYEPEYQKAREELSARLDEVLVSTNDPRMSAEVCVFDLPPFSSPSPKK